MAIPSKRLKVEFDKRLFSISMCYLWGIVATLTIHHALQPSFKLEDLKTKPVAVKVTGVKADAVNKPSASKIAPPKQQESAKPRKKEEPAKIEKVKAPDAIMPLQSKTIETPKPDTVATDDAPFKEVINAEAIEKLEAPPQEFVEEATSMLPTIATEDSPPAPPVGETTEYTEIPGGSVLVVEVILDDKGEVLSSKIAVPTYKPLTDVAIAWSIKAQKWQNIDPPMQPGEIRKIVLRFPYADEESKKYPELP